MRTIKTAGVISPMRGTKTAGSQVAANSLDIAFTKRSTITV
ncbi:hypothetical protein EV06_1772 [Prochlorococcus sp. MIT 0602]|nr:hypothetical protein EV06_1772 [Prochlorococcus sp. MIT 0602]